MSVPQSLIVRLKKFFRAHGLLLVILAGLTAFQLWGIGTVPFHPDEATYLFMSGDLEKWVSDPGSLAFDPEKLDDQPQKYRTIDGPLTRYVLGLGRLAFGLPALPVDWDWGKSWDENASSGALPSPELLIAGRLATTLLVLASLIVIYRIGSKMNGRWSGLFAALVLGLHGLVLLHGRRAMAEGVLIFGVLFAFWSFLHAGKRPWLAGLGAAIAFNAKFSALALLPVGMVAVIWEPLFTPRGGEKTTTKSLVHHVGLRAGAAVKKWLEFLTVFALVTLALNPVYWQHPFKALEASVATRQDLMTRQVADAQTFAPGQVLDSPGKRMAVLIGQLYILPLQFFEVGNYQAKTASAEQAYLAHPGHTLFRGFGWGGLFLILTILGMLRGGLQVWRMGVYRSKTAILLITVTGLLGAALLIAVPLPYQRYPLPLLPSIILWIGLAIGKPEPSNLN